MSEETVPREGDVYRADGHEVLIDHVTADEVFLRVTDGRGGLVAARRLTLSEWGRLATKHGLRMEGRDDGL